MEFFIIDWAENDRSGLFIDDGKHNRVLKTLYVNYEQCHKYTVTENDADDFTVHYERSEDYETQNHIEADTNVSRIYVIYQIQKDPKMCL